MFFLNNISYQFLNVVYFIYLEKWAGGKCKDT